VDVATCSSSSNSSNSNSSIRYISEESATQPLLPGAQPALQV
jgi:hypothetical protein